MNELIKISSTEDDELTNCHKLTISDLEYVKQHNDIILTKNTHTTLQEKTLFKIQEIITSALIAHESKLDKELEINSELSKSIIITADNKKIYNDVIKIKDDYKEIIISPVYAGERLYNVVYLNWSCDNFSRELNKVIKRNLSSKDVFKLMKSMQNIQVEVPSPLNKGDYITTNWFILHTNTNNGSIMLEIDKYLSERLIDTRNTYTKLVTNSFYNLNRASSLKLFKLLCLWINTKENVVYKLDYLLKYIIGENSKLEYYKFCSKYIAVDVEEINRTTHIFVKYKVIKKNNKLHEVAFVVSEKDKMNKDIIPIIDVSNTSDINEFKIFMDEKIGMKISEKLIKNVYDDFFKYKELLEKDDKKITRSMDILKNYCDKKGMNYKSITLRIYPYFKKTLIALLNNEYRCIENDGYEGNIQTSNKDIIEDDLVQPLKSVQVETKVSQNNFPCELTECIELIKQMLQDDTIKYCITPVGYKTWFKDLLDTVYYNGNEVIFNVKKFNLQIIEKNFDKQQVLIKNMIKEYMGDVNIKYNVIDS